jgi:hypothetical protein
MDALPKLSAEQIHQLKRRMHEQVEQFADKLIESVEGAALGRLIADSEEPVRKAIQEFGEAAYQAALQQKVDAAEAAFPPSAQRER